MKPLIHTSAIAGSVSEAMAHLEWVSSLEILNYNTRVQ